MQVSKFKLEFIFKFTLKAEHFLDKLSVSVIKDMTLKITSLGEKNSF